MANGKSKQNISSVNIPKDGLRNKVTYNDRLSKKDLRVFLLLLDNIDGYQYVKVNSKQIALELGLKKKEVNDSLDVLHQEGIIEYGSNLSVDDGCRFTF